MIGSLAIPPATEFTGAIYRSLPAKMAIFPVVGMFPSALLTCISALQFTLSAVTALFTGLMSLICLRQVGALNTAYAKSVELLKEGLFWFLAHTVNTVLLGFGATIISKTIAW